MFRKLQNSIFAYLKRRPFRDEDEMYLYMLSIVATLFCMLVHVYMLVLFAGEGLVFFSGWNLLSIMFYLLLTVMVWRRKYLAVGLCISVEVTLYAVVFGILVGVTSYVLGYVVLVIILQVIMPYGTTRLRVGVTVGVMVATTLCASLSLSLRPHYVFSEELANVLLLSNIYVVMVGTVTQLYVGNLLRNIISRLNAGRMAELSSQAHTDPLTGLYNRRYADLCFADILTEQGPYCVAMLDIDDFKEVNDTYGHTVGDDVLVYLARFLESHLRKSDLVFRWGGEEFLLLLEGVRLPEAYRVLEKLRVGLEESTIVTPVASIRITITIGVAELSPQNPTVGIEKSDSLLYYGKRMGKNMVVSS